ncbi:MAG TPA: tetratricopeptide repeat protein [Blastocatellia bacterium]|nr:tetratricopeptide repeat protein [Blastocatellia bacterium]
MRSRLTPLIKLFYNPLQAMIEISAGAPYVVGAALALLATFAYYELLSGRFLITMAAFSRERSMGMAARFVLIVYHVIGGMIGHASPVLFLIVVFVPACLLATSLIHRRASFSVLLRQEYAPLTSCALYGWAAAHLMMLIPAMLLFQPGGPAPAAAEAALKLVPLPYFVFLIVLAAHAVLRVGYGGATGVVALGSLSLFALPLLPRLLFMLTSPFLLILVIILLRNFLGDMVSSQRAREDFKRNLEASTLNPADASAHYNLGLIYQQRRQYEEAKASFARAIEIDSEETDAHYQLGRIAREEGRLGEAINHFDAVVSRNPEHSQNETWREIGWTYFQAGQYEDARAAFERFIEKRPSDAEGRYRYGLTLHQLGRNDDAAAEMRACIEAVRTSPAYKYRAEKHWASDAESFLRSHGAATEEN